MEPNTEGFLFKDTSSHVASLLSSQVPEGSSLGSMTLSHIRLLPSAEATAIGATSTVDITWIEGLRANRRARNSLLLMSHPSFEIVHFIIDSINLTVTSNHLVSNKMAST